MILQITYSACLVDSNVSFDINKLKLKSWLALRRISLVERSVDERDVSRKNYEILNQPSDELSSHSHGELVYDAKSSWYDKDKVIEKDNDKVSQPFDFSVVTEKIKICDS